MAQKYVTTTVRLTVEQYEYLNRVTRNLSKYIREKLDEEILQGRKPTGIQTTAMEQMYSLMENPENNEENIDVFHQNLINQGVIVPYSYCVYFFKSKENQ